VAHELRDGDLAVVHLRLGLQVEHAQACRGNNNNSQKRKGLITTQ